MDFPCPECKQPYSSKSPPRHFCSKKHCICQDCIAKAFLDNLPTLRCPVCPVDQGNVPLAGKKLEDFKKSLDLLNVIEEQQKECQTHQRELDVLCITCRKIFCYKCIQIDHRKHQSQLFSMVVENRLPEIKKKIKQVNEVFALGAKAHESGENYQHKQLEDKWQEIIDILLLKKAKIQSQIFEVFIAEEKRGRNSGGERQKSILDWIETTQNLLKSVENDDLNQSDKLKKIADLCQQEEIFNLLGADEWKKECEYDAMSMEQGYKSIPIQFNQMLLSLIEKLPLGEFNPNKIEIQPKKVQCGQYVIKLCNKNKDQAKKLKELFKSLPENQVSISVTKDSGIFEIKDDSFNDSFAANIESIVKNATKKERKALAEKVQEVILRCKNLTDKGLESTGKFLEKFEALNVLVANFKQCPEITSKALENQLLLVSSLKNIKVLNLGLRRMSFSNKEFVGIMKSLAKFSNVESLTVDCSKLNRLSNAGLKEGFIYLTKLKNLKAMHFIFEGCKNINDDYLEDIGEILTGIQNLNKLTIDFTK